MDQRIVEFIRGLRAAGVRISLAESKDAMEGIEILGVVNKELFRESLRTTLIKKQEDFAAFDQLFPLYFGSGGPALQNAMEDMNPADQNLLKAAMEALSGRMQQLLDWLTSGDGPTKEELEEMANRAGAQWADSPRQTMWITRRMLQQMGMSQLEDQLRELTQRLQQAGMSQQAIEKLMGVVEANREALEEQMAQQVGLQIAQQRADRPDDLYGSDLMNKPFQSLTEAEKETLRLEVRRLVAQLRSRVALRRKKGNKGKFDAKGTIRSNQRYGGVPLEIKFKKKKLKPSLVLICDVSVSMQSVVEFMLRLIYELQDQVAKARSFAFYGDLQEVSITMAGNQVGEAIAEVLTTIRGRNYGTNLGYSLDTFCQNYLDAVNHRTTVVVIGDGRNNYNDPRVDLIKDIQRRAHKLIWFNPENRQQWHEGDSDMNAYFPHCDAVHIVRNLAQLSTAVDKLFDY